MVNSVFDMPVQAMSFANYLWHICGRLECSEKTVIVAYIYVDRYIQKMNIRYQASSVYRAGGMFAFNQRNSWR